MGSGHCGKEKHGLGWKPRRPWQGGGESQDLAVWPEEGIFGELMPYVVNQVLKEGFHVEADQGHRVGTVQGVGDKRSLKHQSMNS
jgi:hypothetical protein